MVQQSGERLTIKRVAKLLGNYKRAHWYELAHGRRSGEGGREVHLQVKADGGWFLHFGAEAYGAKGGGHFACGILTATVNCRDLARELIEKIEEQKNFRPEAELQGLYADFMEAAPGVEASKVMLLIADWWEDHDNPRTAELIRMVWKVRDRRDRRDG